MSGRVPESSAGGGGVGAVGDATWAYCSGQKATCWCSAGNEEMTFMNHSTVVSLKGTPGFIPTFPTYHTSKATKRKSIHVSTYQNPRANRVPEAVDSEDIAKQLTDLRNKDIDPPIREHLEPFGTPPFPANQQNVAHVSTGGLAYVSS